MEVCEELRKRKVDVCGLQVIRWKNESTRVLGILRRRYKLWWSGNISGIGGIVILVQEVCEKVVDFPRKSDRVMVIVLAFGEQVIRIILAYGPQPNRFYDELAGENERQNPSEVVIRTGRFQWKCW